MAVAVAVVVAKAEAVAEADSKTKSETQTQTNLVLRGQIHPDLAHLKKPAPFRKLRRMKLFMHNPPRRRHPLHVPGADDLLEGRRKDVDMEGRFGEWDGKK